MLIGLLPCTPPICALWVAGQQRNEYALAAARLLVLCLRLQSRPQFHFAQQQRMPV